MQKHLFSRLFQFIFTFAIIIYINSCNSQNVSIENTKNTIAPSQTVAQASSCGSRSSGIKDNPVPAKYAKISRWTDNIKWNCVYNIKDFPSSSVDASFNSARDAAFKNGGGVVFFPAGTYNFTDNIYLKNGVVIRGETPSVTDAKSNSYNPPTKLVFPQYKPNFSGSGTANNTAFKKILTTEQNKDSNIGVVNLDINRSGIDFSASKNSDKNTNQNIIIFGVRSNNVAEPEPQVPASFQNPWQRFSNRFTANIKVDASANTLIANNRFNDSVTDNFDQPNYIVKKNSGQSNITYQDGRKAKFNYTDHYGISLNRNTSSQNNLPNDPNRFPSFFRKGLVIQDNWIYHTMRVAIHATGDGLIIKDNVIRDDKNKQAWIDPTGTKEPKNAATFENRAIDWSGWNVLIEGNDFQVYRHQIMANNYWSIDGEGILIQECCGGTTVNGVTITNNKGNSYIGIYKVPEIKNVLITNNNIFENVTKPSASIYVNADTNRSKHRMDNVKIQNNIVSDSIFARASLGGEGNLIEGNVSKNGGDLSFSCGIKVGRNDGFVVKNCGNK